MKEIEFESEFITVKDLLKATGLVQTGGMAKALVKDEGVLLNGEEIFIPGKKLKNGDVIVFRENKITIV